MLYILLKKPKDGEHDAILEGSFQDMKLGTFFDVIGDSIVGLKGIGAITYNLDIHTARGRMTDHLYVEGIKSPVFSKGVKAEIEKFDASNIQFFPLVIVDEYSNLREVQMSEYKEEVVKYKTVKYDNFSICNLEKLVDCVDHENSDLEYFSPLMSSLRGNVSENMKSILDNKSSRDIDTIYSLKIDERNVPADTLIFRLLDCPRIILVKEKLVQAIKKAELSGFIFIPVSKYSEEITDEGVEVLDLIIEDLEKQEDEITEKDQPIKKELSVVEQVGSTTISVDSKEDKIPSLMSDLEDENPRLYTASDGRLERDDDQKRKIVIKKITKRN